MTRKEIIEQLPIQCPSFDLIPDDDIDYKDGIEDGWAEGALWMQKWLQKKYIERAHDWFKCYLFKRFGINGWADEFKNFKQIMEK